MTGSLAAGAVRHTVFTIERILPGSQAHAFRFWAEPRLRALWTDCHPDWRTLESRFDFREGGEDATAWRLPDGAVLAVRIRYFAILPAERIVYAYAMHRDGACLSGSLVTVAFAAAGARTRMGFTEQAAFLQGAPDQRIAGTHEGFDRLVAAIAADPA